MSKKRMMTAAMIAMGAVALIAGPGAGRALADGREAAFHYAGEMAIDPENGTVALDWEIAVLGAEETSVTFLLNASLGTAAISGAAVSGVEMSTPETFAGTMNAYTVALHPVEDDAPRIIHVDYAGDPMDPPPQHGINSITPRKAEFTVDSFWMPFDQRFSSLITAELAVAIPAPETGSWVAAAIESAEPTAEGFIIRQTRPALDLAFTLMVDPVIHAAPGYVIYDTRDPAGRGIEALQAALSDCTRWLNDFAGPAGPLPDAAITVNDRSAAGYSRATLIALTDISGENPDRLAQFICHEFSHYWSHGNAMSVENWLNEGFADYTALMAVRDLHGEAAFDAFLDRYAAQIEQADHAVPPIWTPGETDRGPYLVQYRKAPLALAWLEAEIGRERFAVFMQRYMRDRIATTPDLLAALEEVAGREAREAFEARLAE